MIYEIVIKDKAAFPDDVELLHDNPRSALETVEALRERLGDVRIVILRDDTAITISQLTLDIESYDIRTVIEEESQLPATYKRGRGGDSDLAIGGDGYRHAVWKPKNPEGDYSLRGQSASRKIKSKKNIWSRLGSISRTFFLDPCDNSGAAAFWRAFRFQRF